MIRILRNIGVRLWITALVFIPLGFYLVSGITKFFPDINPLGFLWIMMVGFILLLGLLLDLAGKKAVTNLIKEAQAWERAGLNSKAEKKYAGALRLYDTFLLGLFSAGQATRKISGAIARFKLNTSVGNENFNLATAMYLKMNPADEAMAERWLRQVQTSRKLSDLDQEVLTLLAETYYTHKSLSERVSDIFQKSGKRDYAAKKVYPLEQKSPFFAKAYPRAGSALADPGETLEKQKPYSQPIIKPVRKATVKQKIEIGKYIRAVLDKAIGLIQFSVRSAGSVFSFLILTVHRAHGFIRDHEKVQSYLKIGFLGFVSICLTAFIINTISHMVKPNPPPAEKIVEKIDIPVVKPFTIQVSAYLKKEFADNYVNSLKKKDIEATVKKVEGGGKTWFVVRVSEFADKKNADSYGRHLKQQKIIDDFFVTNK
jgi:hypothetical protein